MKKFGIILFFLFCLSSLSGCGSDGIYFDGPWYRGDSYNLLITPGTNGKKIRCDDPEFDKFVCLHQSDFYRLIELLQRIKIPKKILKAAKE